MVKLKKKSLENRLKSKRTKMKKIRQNLNDHNLELSQNKEQISKLREDEIKDNDFKKSIHQNPLKRKIVNDNNNSCNKKARSDPVSGPKLRQLEKEAKRKKRLNNLLRYRENYLNNTLKQAKSGNK